MSLTRTIFDHSEEDEYEEDNEFQFHGHPASQQSHHANHNQKLQSSFAQLTTVDPDEYVDNEDDNQRRDRNGEGNGSQASADSNTRGTSPNSRLIPSKSFDVPREEQGNGATRIRHDNHSTTRQDLTRSTSSSDSSQWSLGYLEEKERERHANATKNRVSFEIISAKVTSGSSGKYVSYTILVKRVPGLETQPGLIERRYTHFLQLYTSLKERFSALLGEFPFPKKTLVGNFSVDVIRERSVAFQHLLTFCLNVSLLRNTQEFKDFLYGTEMKEARKMMKNGQFEDAAVIFENIYFIEEKVYLFKSASNTSDENDAQEDDILETLCLLISTLNATDNQVDAQKYAEDAIKLISSKPISTPSTAMTSPPSTAMTSHSYPTSPASSSSPSSSPSSATSPWMPTAMRNSSNSNSNNKNKFEAKSDLIVPLIVLAIRLSKSTGKTHFLPLMEEQLDHFRSKGVNVDMQPTLLELMMARLK